MGGIIINNIIDIIGNYFFPLVLSTFLIYRIDKFLSALLVSNNDFHITITKELKEIKQDILDLRLDMAKNKGNFTPGL